MSCYDRLYSLACWVGLSTAERLFREADPTSNPTCLGSTTGEQCLAIARDEGKGYHREL